MSTWLALYIDPHGSAKPDEALVYSALVSQGEKDDSPRGPRRLFDTLNEHIYTIDRIFCIFPTEWVTTLALSVPTKNARWLYQSLPFAAEEYLAAPIDHYFVALTGIESADVASACALPRELLAQWCDYVDQLANGIHVQFVVDGWLLNESYDRTTVVTQVKDRVLVAYGTLQSLVCDPRSLDLVQEAVNQAEPNSISTKAHTLTFDSTEDFAEHLFKHSSDAQPALTLRQREYRSRPRKTWRWSVGLVSASLALGMLLVAATNQYIAHQHDRTFEAERQRTHQLYRESFAKEGQIVNPLLQARAHLQRLENEWKPEAPEQRFFDLFTPTANVLASWLEKTSSRLHQINYSPKEHVLYLELGSPDIETINTLREVMTDTSLSAEVLSVNEKNAIFWARVRVSANG